MLWGIHSSSSALPTPHKDDEIDPGDDQIEFGEGFEELDDILSMVALTEEAPVDGGDATEGIKAAEGAKEGAKEAASDVADATANVADATADGSEKSVVVPTVAIDADSEEPSGEQEGEAASQGEDTQPPVAVPIPAVSPRKRKQFVAPPSSAPGFRSVGGSSSGDAGAKPSPPPVAPRPKPSFAPPAAPTPAADQEAPVVDALSTSPTPAPLPTAIPAPAPGKPAAGAGISPPAAKRVGKSTSAPALPPAPVGEPKDTGDAERKPAPPAARGGPPQKPARPPPKAGARPPPGRMNARPPKPTFGGSSGNLRRPPKPALPKLAPKPSEG